MTSLTETSAPPFGLSAEQFPFASRFVDIDGCRVHYVDEGEGPVMLFLHGNPTWSFLYRKIIRGLAPRFRCIALDYPGFGLSTARAGYDFRPVTHRAIVEQFIDALELRDITMMVQDWGGPIGLGVAVTRPERFRALVIGNTFAWPGFSNPRVVLFSALMGSPLGHFLIRYFNIFVNVVMPLGVRRHRLPPDVLDAYRRPFAQPASRYPIFVLSRALLASADYLSSLEARLSILRDLPVLLTWGNHYIAFGGGARRRFETYFPNHRTLILDGAGHYIQEDAGKQIANAIQAWWRDTLEPRP